MLSILSFFRVKKCRIRYVVQNLFLTKMIGGYETYTIIKYIANLMWRNPVGGSSCSCSCKICIKNFNNGFNILYNVLLYVNLYETKHISSLIQRQFYEVVFSALLDSWFFAFFNNLLISMKHRLRIQNICEHICH